MCHKMQQENGVASNDDRNYNFQPEMASSYERANTVFNTQILPSSTFPTLMTDAVIVLLYISQSPFLSLPAIL